MGKLSNYSLNEDEAGLTSHLRVYDSSESRAELGLVFVS